MEQDKEYKYDYAISLGLMCGIAGGIKEYNKRFFSLPFDWMITYSIEKIMELIQNHFEDFLNLDIIHKFAGIPDHAFINERYELIFIHDFKDELPLTDQIDEARTKYNRRIERLYKALSKPSLIIRYVAHDDWGIREIEYLNNNYAKVCDIIKQYNTGSDLVLIINSDLEQYIKGDYPYIIIDKDENDCVCRLPFTKYEKVRDLLKDVKPNLDPEEREWLNIHPEEDVFVVQ